MGYTLNFIGYILNFKNGDWCSFKLGDWQWVLSLAFAFGWRPAAPDERDPYFGDDFQEVTEPDARAIGKALHRALATLCKAKQGDPKARAKLDRRLKYANGLAKPPQDIVDLLFEHGEEGPARPAPFDPEVEAGIREFADMASNGPFLISREAPMDRETFSSTRARPFLSVRRQGVINDLGR
jgi:hypothetical protein